jgi:hypothetical protein
MGLEPFVQWGWNHGIYPGRSAMVNQDILDWLDEYNIAYNMYMDIERFNIYGSWYEVFHLNFDKSDEEMLFKLVWR